MHFCFPCEVLPARQGAAGDVETCVIPRVESQANNLTIVPALVTHHTSKGPYLYVTVTKTATNILITKFDYLCWQWEGFSIAIWEVISAFQKTRWNMICWLKDNYFCPTLRRAILCFCLWWVSKVKAGINNTRRRGAKKKKRYFRQGCAHCTWQHHFCLSWTG